MLQALVVVALAFAVANAAFVVGLVARRLVANRIERRAAELERRVTPLAHRLIDGEGVDTLSLRGEEVALARVLARMSRLVKGDARRRIGEHFAGTAAYADERRALGSRRAWRRAAAAFALGDMAVDAAAPDLLRAIDDPNRDVRSAAARSLGRLRVADAVEPLVRGLADGSLPQLVAGSALLAIGADAVPELRQLAVHDDSDVRAVAIELVGLLGSAADADVLEVGLGDPDPRVRARAAGGIGRVGAQSAAAAAAGALVDPSPSVRAAAAQALGAVGERAMLAELVEMAQGDEFEPARAAAYAAGRLDPDALAAVARPGPHVLEVCDLAGL